MNAKEQMKRLVSQMPDDMSYNQILKELLHLRHSADNLILDDELERIRLEAGADREPAVFRTIAEDYFTRPIG